MDRPLLSVSRLRVSFAGPSGELQAVRGLDFSVARGECLGIVGESGSGKSVAAAALFGLLGRDARVSGSARLDGAEILQASARERRRSRMAIVFQEPSRSFDPICSIGKTFEETLRVREPRLPSGACRERAERLLAEAQVPRAAERLGSFPHQLSGGLLQRIAIALALANDPELLVADEPTTALDVTIQTQLLALLAELRRERRLALVLISHDLPLVGRIADRLMVMYSGLAMESGPASEVLERPRSPYTRALLDAMPSPGSHYSRGPLRAIAGSVPDPRAVEPGCPFAPRCPDAVPGCLAAVPDLAEEDGVLYRCLFPGVKP